MADLVTLFNRSWFRPVSWEGTIVPPRSLRRVEIKSGHGFLVVPKQIDVIAWQPLHVTKAADYNVVIRKELPNG